MNQNFLWPVEFFFNAFMGNSIFGGDVVDDVTANATFSRAQDMLSWSFFTGNVKDAYVITIECGVVFGECSKKQYLDQNGGEEEVLEVRGLIRFWSWVRKSDLYPIVLTVSRRGNTPSSVRGEAFISYSGPTQGWDHAHIEHSFYQSNFDIMSRTWDGWWKRREVRTMNAGSSESVQTSGSFSFTHEGHFFSPPSLASSVTSLSPNPTPTDASQHPQEHGFFLYTPWNPRLHHWYVEKKFRAIVWCLVKLHRLEGDENNGFHRLPRDILYYLLQWVAVACGASPCAALQHARFSPLILEQSGDEPETIPLAELIDHLRNLG